MSFNSLQDDGLLQVEISLKVCTCLNNMCTRKWISQQLIMIGPCFIVLNLLSEINEFVQSVRMYLHWKKLFYTCCWLEASSAYWRIRISVLWSIHYTVPWPSSQISVFLPMCHVCGAQNTANQVASNLAENANHLLACMMHHPMSLK